MSNGFLDVLNILIIYINYRFVGQCPVPFIKDMTNLSLKLNFFYLLRILFLYLNTYSINVPNP